MRFMVKIKKIRATISIHAKSNRSDVLIVPRIKALVMFTALVRGNTTWARV
jgi:hypothetical protein